MLTATKTNSEVLNNYSHLSQIKKGESSLTVGSKNIKKHLAFLFPGVKFSVKAESFSMGCSINIEFATGPTQKEVSEELKVFEYGRFNSMEDYSYSEYNDIINTFGGSKYISVRKTESNDKEYISLRKILNETDKISTGDIDIVNFKELFETVKANKAELKG